MIANKSLFIWLKIKPFIRSNVIYSLHSKYYIFISFYVFLQNISQKNSKLNEEMKEMRTVTIISEKNKVSPKLMEMGNLMKEILFKCGKCV